MLHTRQNLALDTDQKTAVVLVTNQKYLFALGTFIINLQDYVQYDQIIVYHEDLTDEDIVKIKKIESKIRFIQYTLDDFCKEFDFEKEIVINKNFIKTYSVLSAIKFKFITHLNLFTTVIFFDLDMLLKDNLNELLKQNFNIAWKSDNMTITNKLQWFGYSKEKMQKIGMYDIYNKIMTPNGGFFIVKNNFDYIKVYNIWFEYMKKFFLIPTILIDELSIAYSSYICKLNIYNIDHTIYNTIPMVITTKTKLIHFFREYKPWKIEIIQYIYQDWIKNYYKCMFISGIESDQVIIYTKINDIIFKNLHLNRWTELFNKFNFRYDNKLEMKYDFTKNFLQFRYNKYINFEITTEFSTRTPYYCKMIINNSEEFIEQKIQYYIYNILKINNFLKYTKNKSQIILEMPKTTPDNIHYDFNWLYHITADIRKAIDIFIDHHQIGSQYKCANIGTLLTFHSSIVYYDMKDNKLTHSNQNEKYLIPVHIFVYEKQISLYIDIEQKYSYVESISRNNIVILSKNEHLFDYIVNNDNNISIKIFDRFLSAEPNGTFSFKNWNRDWEHFAII